MKPYYLPIDSKSLAHYFGSACLRPSRYYNNRPYDIQSKFEDFLFITTHLGIKGTNCCLEIIFTENEIKSKDFIDIEDGFYLYQKPLPISRVKSVIFADSQQKERTIENLLMSTAFIPEERIEVRTEFENIELNRLGKSNDMDVSDWSDQIKKYDKYLGAFAIMRLARNEYVDYSKNYFSTLSFFNKLINPDKNNDHEFHDIFTGEGLYSILDKTIDENVLNLIAKKENQADKIIKDSITKIIDLDRLEKISYIVAVLYTYGLGNEAKKKNISTLILSNFRSGIKESEKVALCYGLNRGYTVFTNKYKSEDKEIIVKFQLNSQLDYYTIESLYQFAFNNIQSERFPYLDDWCPISFKDEEVSVLKESNIKLEIESKELKSKILRLEDQLKSSNNKDIKGLDRKIAQEISNYYDMSVDDLKKEAKSRGIKNYTKLHKKALFKELLELIFAYQRFDND